MLSGANSLVKLAPLHKELEILRVDDLCAYEIGNRPSAQNILSEQARLF